MLVTKEAIFTFDFLEEIVSEYFDESEEEANASITFENGMLTFTVCRFRNCEITVYHVKETPELYAELDAKYLDLADESQESDFWVMWTAILDVFNPYKITDEIFNP